MRGSTLQDRLNKLPIANDFVVPFPNRFSQAAMVLVSGQNFPEHPPEEITQEQLGILVENLGSYDVPELLEKLKSAYDTGEIAVDPWAVAAARRLRAVRRFGETASRQELPDAEPDPLVDFVEVALQKAATVIATGQNSRAAATNLTGEGLPAGILQRPGGVLASLGAAAVSRFSPDDDESLARSATSYMGVSTSGTHAVFPGDIGEFRTNGKLPLVKVIPRAKNPVHIPLRSA